MRNLKLAFAEFVAAQVLPGAPFVGIHAFMLGDEVPVVGQTLDPDMMGGTHRSRWRMPS